MAAISWCDRDIGQTSNTLSEKVSRKDKVSKITRMKYSPKQSSRKAACDLQNGFKSLKKLCKIKTFKNEPSISISERVDNVLTSVCTKVRLKKSNRENLLDFYRSVPKIFSQSYNQRFMRKGFISNRMIEEGCKMCPSYINMMKTMPKN